MRGCCKSPHPLVPGDFRLKFLRMVDGKGETSYVGGRGQRSVHAAFCMWRCSHAGFLCMHFKAVPDGKTISP